MVALCEVGNVESLLMNTALSGTKLWTRPAESLTTVELIAFMRKMRDEGAGYEAHTYVDLLLDELDRASARGQIEAPQALNFTRRGPTLTSGEVRAVLSALSTMRCKAVLFAVFTGMTLGETISLAWHEALTTDYPDAARQVLRSVPRHIFSERVFWEQGRRHAVPLYGLQDQYSALVRHISWTEFADAVRDAIPYDYDAELDEFNKSLIYLT